MMYSGRMKNEPIRAVDVLQKDGGGAGSVSNDMLQPFQWSEVNTV